MKVKEFIKLLEKLDLESEMNFALMPKYFIGYTSGLENIRYITDLMEVSFIYKDLESNKDTIVFKFSEEDKNDKSKKSVTQ